MEKIDNPCYKCEKRNMLCRLGCKEYEEFQKEESARKQKLKDDKAKITSYIAYQKDKKNRIERLRKQRRC